jgi:hypothetical protein
MFTLTQIQEMDQAAINTVRPLLVNLVALHEKTLEWAKAEIVACEATANKAYFIRLAGEHNQDSFLQVLPKNSFNFSARAFNTEYISALRIANYKKWVSTSNQEIQVISTKAVAIEILDRDLATEITSLKTQIDLMTEMFK